MGKLLALLGGWQGYVAAAAFSAILAVGATYYITSMSYKVTISNMERDAAKQGAENTKASLDQFEADAGRIHDAANTFAGVQISIDAQFAALSKDFHNAVKAKPLPPGCVPDPVRMHSLSAAIAAVNAAVRGELGAAMPTTP